MSFLHREHENVVAAPVYVKAPKAERSPLVVLAPKIKPPVPEEEIVFDKELSDLDKALLAALDCQG